MPAASSRELPDQSLPVVRDGAHPDVAHQVGKRTLRQVTILDDVRHAGWRARVVLEHVETTVAAADDVHTADVDVIAERYFQSPHLRAEVRVAEHQFGGHDAVAQDPLLVIDILDEPVERGDALDDAALDHCPFFRGEDAGYDVERQDPVDLLAVGVNGERDAEIEELVLCGLCAAPKFRQAQAVDAFAHRPGMRRRHLRCTEEFAIEPARLVVFEQSGRFPDGHRLACPAVRDGSTGMTSTATSMTCWPPPKVTPLIGLMSP